MRLYVFIALLLPILLMSLSWGVASFIPGCTIDEASGASAACGSIGSLLEFGVLGGILWVIVGVVGFIPVGIINRWINRNSIEDSELNYSMRALEAENKKNNV
jgi:hypothetical protein